MPLVGATTYLGKLQTSNKLYQEISQRCEEDKYMTGYTEAKDDANPPKVSYFFREASRYVYEGIKGG